MRRPALKKRAMRAAGRWRKRRLPLARTWAGAGFRPFAKAWRPKTNPLTKRERWMVRQEASILAKLARHRTYWPRHERAATWGEAAGLLNALSLIDDDPLSIKAYRAASRLRAAAMSKRNPLLQVVLPNGHGSRSKLHPPEHRGGTRALRRAVRQQQRFLAWSRRNRTSLATAEWREWRRLVKRLTTKRSNPVGFVNGYRKGVRGGQRVKALGFVGAAEARTFPGFAKALALHRSFHGKAPTHFTKVRLEDGHPGVTRRAVVLIGEAPAIEYRTWRHANSTKSHTRDGRRIVWRHKLGEKGGKPALWVHDPVSGVTSLLGGTYAVRGRPAFYHH